MLDGVVSSALTHSWPELAPEHSSWLDQFRAKHGRPPRVLHIGNIANNAYVNAKFLNEAGLDCDVLCYDYYHIMGCPEWEDAEFEGNTGDQFRPDWTKIELRGFKRPEWFVQGPMALCLSYLIARRTGANTHATYLWRRLAYANKTATVELRELIDYWIDTIKATASRYSRALLDSVTVKRKLHDMEVWITRRVSTEAVKRRVAWVFALIRRLGRTPHRWLVRITGAGDFYFRAEQLMQEFRTVFPGRRDHISVEDLIPYRAMLGAWREVFAQYDLVQAYSTDPIWPMMAGVRYVAFEHGTLRSFTMEDSPLHRLTALAYRKAEHVFITNGDCLEYAHKLGLMRYSPMVHPVDVRQHERVNEASREAVRTEYQADVLLLCPLRHDWAVKGTDIHLRALPLIKRQVRGRVVLLLTEWGREIEESRVLIDQLGCRDNIVWLAPLCRTRLIRYTAAADVVLDQMALPHFGATAPQALASGTPVVMSYRPASTAWIVDEPAPILAAFTPEEVAAAVMQALEPGWRKQFVKRARNWIYAYHHHNRVVHDHLSVYKQLLNGTDLN